MSVKRFNETLEKIFYMLFGKRNIIIFAGQTDFDGNARALYEYMLKNGFADKYKYVWVVNDYKKYRKKSNSVVDFITLQSGESLREKFALYIKKHYYNACSKFHFSDIGCSLYANYSGRLVYLTHGCPPIKHTRTYINLAQNRVKSALITSKNVESTISRVFNVSSDKLFICGLPRNDIIFNSSRKYDGLVREKYNKIILWMPTFRKSIYFHGEERRIDSEKEYLYGLPLVHTQADLERINKKLIDLGCLIIIKPHPSAAKEGIESINLDNIVVWTNEWLENNDVNLYSLFPNTDAMISDYSSVTFDFMLTNHPIGYIVDDINEYKLGFAFDNVEEVMAGPKLTNMDDLLKFLEDIAAGRDDYAEQRRKVNEWVNTFRDGNNCKRITEIFDL